MPASLMAGIGTHPSVYTDNVVAVHSPFNPYQGSGSAVHSNFRQNQPQGGFGFNQNALLPPITTNSFQVLRQTMDESNHEMVNTLTRQIGDVFNPLINNTNNTYQLLAQQMGRIAEFFGTPPPPNHIIPQIRHVVVQPNTGFQNQGVLINEPEQPQIVQQPVQQAAPPLVEGNAGRNNPPVIMVQRHEDPDQVFRRVQQQNFGGQNNIAQIVENILVQNGVNIDTRRPAFTSPLNEFVLETEIPRGTKIPKFTKFSGESNESTVEHIARFEMEAGNLAQQENLKLRFFPSSLTQSAFKWFASLPPGSIHHWNQLQRLFHEQFYVGESKVILKELSSIKRSSTESTEEYFNRFRLMKSRCLTQIPESELVEMAAGGLEYSIRKKIDTQHLRDMAQLAGRVRQVERLKAEKFKFKKNLKKDKIAYVEPEDYESDFDQEVEYVDESEVNLAELKPGPPYVCKVLRPSNGKNPPENNKNNRFVTKTYTFDVTNVRTNLVVLEHL